RSYHGHTPVPFAAHQRMIAGPLRMRESSMDLGIAGRKAIVCASSRGLGRACALALANCEVVVNGRDSKALETAADDIRKATGAKIHAVQADVATAEGQAMLLEACP